MMAEMLLRLACRNCYHGGPRRQHCYIKPRLVWMPPVEKPGGTGGPLLMAYCPHCFRYLGSVDAEKWGAFADNDRPNDRPSIPPETSPKDNPPTYTP